MRGLRRGGVISTTRSPRPRGPPPPSPSVGIGSLKPGRERSAIVGDVFRECAVEVEAGAHRARLRIVRTYSAMSSLAIAPATSHPFM